MSNNEIPVRRREGGVPWWLWLIALAILALLAWWLLNNMNQGQVGGETSPSASPSAPTESIAPAESGSPEASGSPTSSWLGGPILTVILPAQAGS